MLKSTKLRFSIFIFAFMLVAWFISSKVQQSNLQENLPQKSQLELPKINVDDPFLIIDENIDDAGISNDENIFFIESHDSESTQIRTRQACSIESAARAYPNRKIFVLFVTKTDTVKLKNSILARTLLGYRNVFFKYLNVEEFTRGTPTEAFIKSGKLDTSKSRMVHTSDVMRILTLWKFGGTYLDLDVITRKNMTLTDYACFESPGFVNNAIMSFSRTAKDIALLYINYQAENFNGNVYQNPGPDLLTGTFKKFCQVENGTLDTSCKGFNLLPTEDCYQINWREVKKFFQEDDAEEVKERAKNSHFIHIWSSRSSNEIANVDSKAAITNFSAEFCPKIFYTIDKYF